MGWAPFKIELLIKKFPISKEIKIWKSINFKIDARCKGGKIEKKEKEEKQTAMNEYACE